MVGPKEPTQQEDNCASSKFGARGGSLELAAAAVHFDRAVIVFQPKGVPKIYNNQGTAGDPIALWYRANHYEMLEGQGAVAAGCTKTYARRKGWIRKRLFFMRCYSHLCFAAASGWKFQGPKTGPQCDPVPVAQLFLHKAAQQSSLCDCFLGSWGQHCGWSGRF